LDRVEFWLIAAASPQPEASPAPPQIRKDQTTVLAESQIHGLETIASEKLRMAFSQNAMLFDPCPWALPKATV
jgi:hypothetical protein